MSVPERAAREEAELARIGERYARRAERVAPTAGNDAFTRFMVAEREAIYRTLLERHAGGDLRRLSLLEIGCGGGGEIARLIAMGLDPARIVGNELLPERLAAARARLPAEVRLIGGDASTIDLPNGSFDVVFQSTVFTSMLDEGLRERVARRMWELLRPGGAILWYDFTVDNPRNRDVRGVPIRRVRELFPSPPEVVMRVTVAPPIGRVVARFGAWAYRCAGALPFLRTHAILWIPKPMIG
jgi:SAM-dependent methyltransferase